MCEIAEDLIAENTQRLERCTDCIYSCVEQGILICRPFNVKCIDVKKCNSKETIDAKSTVVLDKLESQIQDLMNNEHEMSACDKHETEAYYKGRANAYATILEMIRKLENTNEKI